MQEDKPNARPGYGSLCICDLIALYGTPKRPVGVIIFVYSPGESPLERMIDKFKVTYFVSDLDKIYLAFKPILFKLPSDCFSASEEAENRTLRGLASRYSCANL